MCQLQQLEIINIHHKMLDLAIDRGKNLWWDNLPSDATAYDEQIYL